MKKIAVERKTSARIPTELGEFQLCYYQTNIDEKEHLALVLGDIHSSNPVLVRIHSECFTGDVLGSLRCDCGPQLNEAMHQIATAGAGIIIYLRQEGRGIGLLDKLRAYNLQDDGYDTVEANLMLGHQADARDYTVAAHMLHDLSVPAVRLLTNNPSKIEGLEQQGISVAERIPMPPLLNGENKAYLTTKVERMRHMLNLNGRSQPTPSTPHNPAKSSAKRPSTRNPQLCPKFRRLHHPSARRTDGDQWARIDDPHPPATQQPRRHLGWHWHRLG